MISTLILDLISIKALIRIAILTLISKISSLLIRKLIIYIVSINLPIRLETSFLNIYDKTIDPPKVLVKDLPNLLSLTIYLSAILSSLPQSLTVKPNRDLILEPRNILP